jgi:RsiW-degrading membrane proteinase PrsW (M82 family)
VDTNDIYCRCCGVNLRDWVNAQGFTEEDSTFSGEGFLAEAVRSLIKPSPVKAPPNVSVFANRQNAPLTPYVVWAALLLVMGLGASYGGDWLSYLGFILAGHAAPLLYVLWMVRSDRYEREPFALVAYCFGWGAFVGIAAGVLNAVITAPFLGAGGAGFIEEPLKALGVYLVARSRLGHEFNDHLDGMVYGAAAGAGFAGLENFWYLYEMIVNNSTPAFTAVLLRSMTAFMHIAWTAIAGRSLGLAKALKGSVNLSDLVPGVLVAAIIHMAWNIVPPFIAFGFILPFMVESMRRQISTALADERRWGYECFAPNEGLEGVE